MRSKLLVATTAAALAAGTCFAMAQGMSSSQGLQSTPSTQNGADKKGAQQDKAAPANRAGQSNGNQGTERGSMSQNAPAPGKLDQKNAQERGANPTTSGQAPSSRESQSGSGTMSPSQRGSTSGQSPSAQSSPGAASPNAPSPGAMGPSVSGSASTSGSASLTTEQKTKIRQTVLTQSSAPRVNNVNFSLNVGTVVPRSVHVVPVPETIVEIQPAWRGYMYFLVGDEIVIVEPGSLKIVAVIAA